VCEPKYFCTVVLWFKKKNDPPARSAPFHSVAIFATPFQRSGTCAFFAFFGTGAFFALFRKKEWKEKKI
jgi:hypothetical protein